MQSAATVTRPALAASELPKFDQRLQVRLDSESMAGLERLAAAEFLEPAVYARQVLLKHVTAAAQPSRGTEAAA